MPIEWFEKENKNSVVTVYNNNITVRRNVAKYFENASGVAIGLDKEQNSLIIKKINNLDKETSFKNKDLFKMDINASYGRINSKNIVKVISNLQQLDFSLKNSFKYQATWDSSKEMLIINMKEEYHE